jgi:catechol 2,3-dioxygenase
MMNDTTIERVNNSAGPEFGIHPPGDRLPNATQIGRVRLQVADLGRSITFYERVLGLSVTSVGPGEALATPRASAETLIELVERPGASPAPPRGRLGLFHFAILLPDRAALGRLIPHLSAAGVHVAGSDHLVSEALYLSDPDGLGIEVYADRSRAGWQAHDGELVMSTLPLDFDDVVSAAGGERFDGMPAGTRLGHVHLHVGDIDRAAAFYHEALGFDKVVWSHPHALFLSAGGYHHHLGVNTWAGPRATPPADGEAQLLEWELLLPTDATVAGVRTSLETAGHQVEAHSDGLLARDPWGTRLRIRARSLTTSGATRSA